MNEFIVDYINGRYICIKGIGKLFYQDGLPISISIAELKERNIEVSLFHVADECLKVGWSARTTYNKLKTDVLEDIESNNIDLKLLEKFCYAEYEEQREMIFQYLFGTESKNINEATLNNIKTKWNKN